MVRVRLVIALIAAVTAIFGFSTNVMAGEDRLTGVIIGRTGEIIHIGISQPVREGTIFKVMQMESEPPIAEAKVIGCSQERPFVALAEVTKGDIVESIAIGAHAYTNPGNVKGPDVPKQLSDSGDGSRLSVQAGVFQPKSQLVRDTVSDRWESFRLAYSLIRSKNFEAQLSSGYDKGAGSFASLNGTIERKVEVIPAVLMGRIKPLGVGGSRLILGAGGGIYRIKTSETGLSTTTVDKTGYELCVGSESHNGWMTELRYRNAKGTSIEGYSFSLGTKF